MVPRKTVYTISGEGVGHCPDAVPTMAGEGVFFGAAGGTHYSLTQEASRLGQARLWGLQQPSMMSGSTTPLIHNQIFIGMHQHYWGLVMSTPKVTLYRL